VIDGVSVQFGLRRDNILNKDVENKDIMTLGTFGATGKVKLLDVVEHDDAVDYKVAIDVDILEYSVWILLTKETIDAVKETSAKVGAEAVRYNCVKLLI
jgi:hypothetical protein